MRAALRLFQILADLGTHATHDRLLPGGAGMPVHGPLVIAFTTDRGLSFGLEETDLHATPEALAQAIAEIVAAHRDGHAPEEAPACGAVDHREVLVELLRDVRALLDAEACPDGALSTYGHFPGGAFDPRRFKPDAEVCTADELRLHAEACEAWDRGERPDIPLGADVREVNIPAAPERTTPAGRVLQARPAMSGVAMTSGSPLGMGTFGDRGAVDLLARVDAMLATLEKRR